MGLIRVPHKDAPLGWTIDIMGRLRAFASSAQSKDAPLWETVFVPHDVGSRAISADRMAPMALGVFVDRLKRFQTEAGLSAHQRGHVKSIMADLNLQKKATGHA